MNKTTKEAWQIWKFYRLLRHLFILLTAGGVAYFVLLDIFYRGKAMDSAFEAFLFYWTLAFVPTSIAYAIVEIKYKRKYSSIS